MHDMVKEQLRAVICRENRKAEFVIVRQAVLCETHAVHNDQHHIDRRVELLELDRIVAHGDAPSSFSNEQ